MFSQPAGLDGPRTQRLGSPRGNRVKLQDAGSWDSPFGQMSAGQGYGIMANVQQPRQDGPPSATVQMRTVEQRRQEGQEDVNQSKGDPLVWVRGSLARDPFTEPGKCPNWHTFWLMSIVQTMGMPPENGMEMIGPNFSVLGKILQTGVPNSGFHLVKRLLQGMYHSTYHMVKLFEADKKNSGYVLVALQNGIASEDRETAVMILSAIRNMAHKSKSTWLQNFFWGWFEDREQGGLLTVAQALGRHKDEGTRKAAVEIQSILHL